MNRKPDLADRVFGALLVVDVDGYDNGGHLRWLCLCECGNTTRVATSNLLSGHTKSCGCLRAKRCGEIRRGQRAPIPVGARFGMLRIICDAGDDPMHRAIVMAKCDCGKVSFPRWNNVRHGITKSCGCQKLKGLAA